MDAISGVTDEKEDPRAPSVLSLCPWRWKPRCRKALHFHLHCTSRGCWVNKKCVSVLPKSPYSGMASRISLACLHGAHLIRTVHVPWLVMERGLDSRQGEGATQSLSPPGGVNTSHVPEHLQRGKTIKVVHTDWSVDR